jgi:hypothetical protein
MPGARFIAELISSLCLTQQADRDSAAKSLFELGAARVHDFLDSLSRDAEFQQLLGSQPVITVGIAVTPETFERIRAANGSPSLAGVPPDQDAVEIELQFPAYIQLDILTTRSPSGGGAIARFLAKFGEGIQQVEIDVTDIDRATEMLRTRFQLGPVYAKTRAGANGTRVNFFLAPDSTSKKVLVELVEHPKQ